MPHDNPYDPIAAVRALAEELTGTVSLACALAESGRTIDLAGLDRRIGLLCAKALDLPSDEGRRVRPRLIALPAPWRRCRKPCWRVPRRPGDLQRSSARQKAASWSL